MVDLPEWGDRLSKETLQILPPFYFNFKKKEKNMKLFVKSLTHHYIIYVLLSSDVNENLQQKVL